MGSSLVLSLLCDRKALTYIWAALQRAALPAATLCLVLTQVQSCQEHQEEDRGMHQDKNLALRGCFAKRSDVKVSGRDRLWVPCVDGDGKGEAGLSGLWQRLWVTTLGVLLGTALPSLQAGDVAVCF